MSLKHLLGVQNIFSRATRERFVTNLQHVRVPSSEKPNAASASVLVPICTVDNVVSLLYTVRATNLRSHSGHISFPGGKADANETPVETALRETDEEIGLLPSKIEIWGQGPAFPGRSNKLMVTPVIGSVLDLNQNDLKINEKEVNEVFTVPLWDLCRKENHFYTQFRNGFIMPVFLIEDYKIWGMTAYITHVVLSCLLPKNVYYNDWKSNKIIIK